MCIKFQNVTGGGKFFEAKFECFFHAVSGIQFCVFATL